MAVMSCIQCKKLTAILEIQHTLNTEANTNAETKTIDKIQRTMAHSIRGNDEYFFFQLGHLFCSGQGNFCRPFKTNCRIYGLSIDRTLGKCPT